MRRGRMQPEEKGDAHLRGVEHPLILGPLSRCTLPTRTFAVLKRHEILRYSWVDLKPLRTRTTPFVRGPMVPEQDHLPPAGEP